MKKALKHCEEINRCKIAINKSKSIHLKKQYTKHISRLEKELKGYCKYQKINYKKLWELFNIKKLLEVDNEK